MADSKTTTKPDDVAISVKDLHKTFRIPLEGGNNLKQRIVNFAKRKKGYREFSPLNGVSFEIKKGEFFGIVGRNGSGKSTLLKTIAGIYTADSGKLRVNGKLVPFIELGVGFNPELTGRENVYLNGALLGFSRDEMTAMYDDIVEFAELEDFMDERLKNYSSGMQVRLAFSIAIRAQGDILLLDEVLAVGDSAFQKKCFDYFKRLKLEGRTVVLVTHSMSAVQQYCSRALLLNEGKVESIGDSSEIAQQYEDLFVKERVAKQDKRNEQANSARGERQGVTSQHVSLTSVTTWQNDKSSSLINAHSNFSIELEIESTKQIDNATLGINIINSSGYIMLATGTKRLSPSIKIRKGRTKIIFDVDNIFTDDSYYINVALADDSNDGVLLFQESRVHEFEIGGVKYARHSLTHPEIDVRVE